MIGFKIFAFTAIVIGSCWAMVPYDKLKLNIFDSSRHQFEQNVYNSMEIVKNFFAGDEFKTSLEIMNLVPYLDKFGAILSLACKTLETTSDWRATLAKALDKETDLKVLQIPVDFISARMKTLNQTYALLGENNTDKNGPITTAQHFHTQLLEAINIFDIPTTFLKKYPLVGTPVLLQLASAVLLFNPIFHKLIPFQAKTVDLSCKMLDILLDYLPYTIYARLLKIEDISSFYVHRIRYLPYNPKGYNTTAGITCTGIAKNEDEVSFKDAFGDAYSNIDNGFGASMCTPEYLSYVRHRVEKLFPIRALRSTCMNKNQKPKPLWTAKSMGYLTIIAMKITAKEKPDESKCDDFIDDSGIGSWSRCDPFVKVFIDGDKVYQSQIFNDTEYFEINEPIYSELTFNNNATMKVEVWDFDPTILGLVEQNPELIQREEDFVRNFCSVDGSIRATGNNQIEVVAFWRDTQYI